MLSQGHQSQPMQDNTTTTINNYDKSQDVPMGITDGGVGAHGNMDEFTQNDVTKKMEDAMLRDLCNDEEKPKPKK